jgi:uncharacterized protein
MQREISRFLTDWLHSTPRKPLIIRGARQVGKTWLVRDLAQSQQLKLVELNFEKRPDLRSLFSSNEPREILRNLRAFTNVEIKPSQSLLFLDEIQAVPELLGKLRWFAEEMAELAIVAAGSLLDFALAKHDFSMPVGRISYLYLEPLSFEEFLEASDRCGLKEYILDYDWPQQVPESVHTQLMQAVKEYLVVGGMPEAVALWISTGSFDRVSQAHFDLLTTYREDFTKYSGRLSVERLEEVMAAVPKQLGRKFVFKEVNPEVAAVPIKQALDLLAKARVCHRVGATSANGLPLGAELNDKFFKMVMLDTGLCGASLGLSLGQLNRVTELTMVNSGGMAEQLVGQLLRTISPPYIPSSLYYWQRTDKGAAAEIDYLIQHESRVIPVEVKAGSTGSLKSLHQFMKQKGAGIAIRTNSDFPSLGPVQVADSQGSLIEYKLLSIPFYLIGQLHRLINSSER